MRTIIATRGVSRHSKMFLTNVALAGEGDSERGDTLEYIKGWRLSASTREALRKEINELLEKRDPPVRSSGWMGCTLIVP